MLQTDADFPTQRVEEHDGIHPLERPGLHAVTSATMPSMTALIKSGKTSTSYISARKPPWISRTVMPRAYNARTLSSNPVNRRSWFPDQPRLELPFAVARHVDPEWPIVGQHRLAPIRSHFSVGDNHQVRA
jgi:hypothetical protein